MMSTRQRSAGVGKRGNHHAQEAAQHGGESTSTSQISQRYSKPCKPYNPKLQNPEKLKTLNSTNPCSRGEGSPELRACEGLGIRFKNARAITTH